MRHILAAGALAFFGCSRALAAAPCRPRSRRCARRRLTLGRSGSAVGL